MLNLAALLLLAACVVEWRLGQLAANLATTAGRLDSGGYGTSTTSKHSLPRRF